MDLLQLYSKTQSFSCSPDTVADAELSEKVHEEGTVEVLAHLVEDKPVAQLAVVNESPDLVHFVRSFEVSVHPHVDHVEPQP